MRNCRVLIADDQPEIHNDFSELLEPRRDSAATDALAGAFIAEEEDVLLSDIELLHAYGGQEAIDVVRQGRQEGRPVAVVYMDVRMPPGMDGIKAAQSIREIDPDIEIVIMTAYTDRPLSEIVRDIELLHKLLYIRKPFSREEVQQITLSLVEKWNVEQALASRQRELVANHRRLEAVLDATGDAMAMYDPDGRLVFANQGYGKLFGMAEGELRQASQEELSERVREGPGDGGSAGPGDVLVIESAEQGAAPAGEAGHERLFRRFKAPVRDDGKHVMGSLVVYRDVSSEVEADRMKAQVLRLRSELEPTYSFSAIVGTSAAMQRVYALIKQAAESGITTLVLGESGTGKELVAKALHYDSARSDRPFEVINCVAIPETLIESELFGHEKGAFTGAAQRRIGAFERANTGTIFLDEIGDMPLGLQARLLRVLQEREIQRIGGTATIPVDVRVVAATNKNLQAALKKGQFRRDLFYRIATFPIHVPPLRDRREDIPLLAKHFLDKEADRLGKNVDGISAAALRLLIQYHWPGNVRELKNAIEGAVLLETSRVLQAESIQTVLSPISTPAAAKILPLAEVERQTLLQALAHAGNNVSEAARALGINRTTLYRKLKKYELSSR